MSGRITVGGEAKFGRQVCWGRFPGFCRCLGLWAIPYPPISWKWRFQANWKKLLGALMGRRVMVWWKKNWGSRGKFGRQVVLRAFPGFFLDLWVCGLSSTYVTNELKKWRFKLHGSFREGYCVREGQFERQIWEAGVYVVFQCREGIIIIQV